MPYLKTGYPPVDPWGSPYSLVHQDGAIVVTSPGLDKIPGTEDDVTSVYVIDPGLVPSP